MIILICLLILLAIGIFIQRRFYKYEIWGLLLAILTTLYLIFHILFWSLASYNYGIFLAKRNAFVETLKEARENNNSIELAAITKDISQWNQDLAEVKYDLTVFMIKDYTDKRVEYLQPIR